MTTQTQWLPGLVVVGAGAATAVLYLLTQAKKEGSSASGQEDLEARYRSAIFQLKEHSAQKHLMALDAWTTENERLEKMATAALKAKEHEGHEALKAQARAEKKAAANAAPKGFFAKNPALGGALVGGSVVGFLALLFVLVSKESTARVDDMPATAPASAPAASAAAKPLDDLKVRALEAKLEQNADDVDAVAELTHEYIRRQMWDQAAPLIARGTSLDPYNVRLRTYRAVLSAVDGQVDVALAQLEHIAETFAPAWEARLYAGTLALEAEQPQKALTHLERYLVEAPASEQPPMIRMGVERLRAQLANTGAP